MGKLHMPLKIIIVWVLAVFFLGDSILRSLRSNFNFGLLLVYLITGGLWVYGLFYRPIDAFCAAGAGRVLKILFFCGIGVLAALVAFVVASGYAQQPTGGERAIIVLGAGLRKDTPSDLLRRRLDAAFDAWSRDRQALVVVTGGRAEAKPFPKGWPWRATYSKRACRRARSWWNKKAPPPRKTCFLPVSCWLRGAWTRASRWRW